MEDNRTMFISPINQLFKSRKFILLLATFITSIVIRLIPELEQYASEIMNGLWVLAGVLIYGQSIEDAAKMPKTILTDSPKVDKATIELIKQTLIDLGFSDLQVESILDSKETDDE